MKQRVLNIVGFGILVVLLSSFLFQSDRDSLPFKKGEYMHYEIEFGFFDLAEAEMSIFKEETVINDRPAIQADLKGWTKGMMSWFAKVKDNWHSFIDKETLYPHHSFRDIKENGYRLYEKTDFDYEARTIKNYQRKVETDPYKEQAVLDLKEDAYDLLSGYLHLRQLDYNQLQKGDSIVTKSYFEDKFYDLVIIYDGKEEIDTDFGDLDCFKLTPVLPDNTIFRGENALSLWLSSGKNQIIVKIEAKLLIGSATVTLDKYRGLRHPLNFRE